MTVLAEAHTGPHGTKMGDKKHYFDRFGLPPPTKLEAYLRGDV